ncbi:MAG: EamA family transporter [Alphaproteobacteria bacterium]|nr:EamA family transporter [Alphaproteobacteria bacterium]
MAQSSSPQRVLLPALFVFLWSTGFIATKAGLPYAEPLTFLLLRFAIVAALMLPVALVGGARWPRGIMILHVAVVGVLIQAGYLGGVFVAISRGIPAGISALIVGAQPLLMALMAWPMTGERVAPVQWLGLVLGFAGVGLVMASRFGFGAVDTLGANPLGADPLGADPLGIGLCVMATVAIALGSIYQKRYCVAVDLRSGAVVQYVAAMLPMLALAPVLETMEIRWSAGFLLLMVWLVLVLSIGAVSLLYVLIRRGAAADVASLFYLVPPTTALMGFLLFGETLSAITILGMVLAAVGVALVNRPRATGRPG